MPAPTAKFSPCRSRFAPSWDRGPDAMKRNPLKKNLRHAGFTLIELMLVLLILSVVLGVVFSQLSQSQQRLNAEETKLDDLQQARDFVDQFFRDINQIGTPNTQIMDTTLLTASSAPIGGNTWSIGFIND